MATDPDKISMSGSRAARERSVLSYLREVKTSLAAAAIGTIGRVPITSITAANDATIDFTSGIDSTYKMYLLTMAHVVPATDGAGAYIRYQSGGSWQTSSYHYAGARWISGFTSLRSTSAAQIALSDTNIGSATGEGFMGNLHLSNPADTALYKQIYFAGSLINTSNLQEGLVQSGAWRGGTGAVTGIRFFFSSGNVESGEFTLYGLAGA